MVPTAIQSRLICIRTITDWVGVVVLWYCGTVVCLLYHILYKMYRVQSKVWGFIKNKTVDSFTEPNLHTQVEIYLNLGDHN